MNDTLIVTIFTVIDDVMATLGHRTHVLAHSGDSEVLTVATVAACYFQNHHQRALSVLRGLHYLSGSLSLSRFNRRLHALAHWFSWLLDLLCELFAFRAAAFTIDSLPVPVCQRVRARRSRKVQGSAYLRLLCCQRATLLWLAAAFRDRGASELRVDARKLPRSRAIA